MNDLPYVSVHDADNKLVGEFRGETAEDEASALIGRLMEQHPDVTEYDMSVSDERCPQCSLEFWHEAATGGTDDEWHCPKCDAVLSTNEQES